MIDNISAKILKMNRTLPKPKNTSNSSIIVPTTPSPKKIRVISTYGSDSDLVDVVRNFQGELLASPSFASTPDLSSSSSNASKYLCIAIKNCGTFSSQMGQNNYQ